MSEKTDKKTLLQALFEVQKAAPSIDKSADNPFFKSKYADLPAIWQAIKPLLSENRLLISHTMESYESGEVIRTKIYHVDSGDFIESTSKITLTKSTAQEYGSYITYMRRYAVSAMLGLVTDEDDDGNKASQQKPKPAVKPLTGDEFTMIQQSLKNATLETIEVEKAKARDVFPRANDAQKKSIKKFVSDAENRVNPPVDDIPNFGGANE